MTREQYLERHRYTLAGIIMDGISRKMSGQEVALFIQHVLYHRIDRALGDAYDALVSPPQQLASGRNGTNGHAAPARKP